MITSNLRACIPCLDVECGCLIGPTLAYFQVVRRESVSKKSDVYSYGIIVWEVITQEVPFSEVVSYALPFKVAEGEVGNSNIHCIVNISCLAVE